MKESAEPMVIYCFASEVTGKTEGKANSKKQNDIAKIKRK
jgi:hypothetical protein